MPARFQGFKVKNNGNTVSGASYCFQRRKARREVGAPGSFLLTAKGPRSQRAFAFNLETCETLKL
jgi:hypothetical protein